MKKKQYPEYIKYLEGEADYLEKTDSVKYADMIQKRRQEAKRIKEKMNWRNVNMSGILYLCKEKILEIPSTYIEFAVNVGNTS